MMYRLVAYGQRGDEMSRALGEAITMRELRPGCDIEVVALAGMAGRPLAAVPSGVRYVQSSASTLEERLDDCLFLRPLPDLLGILCHPNATKFELEKGRNAQVPTAQLLQLAELLELHRDLAAISTGRSWELNEDASSGFGAMFRTGPLCAAGGFAGSHQTLCDRLDRLGWSSISIPPPRNHSVRPHLERVG